MIAIIAAALLLLLAVAPAVETAAAEMPWIEVSH